MCFVESDTLGNLQNKGSNTISPHFFAVWCSIRIIIKTTHLCNCVIHQHNLKCIWLWKHNNWYHMTVKSSGFISIYWLKCIIVLIIICYILYRLLFLRSIKIYKREPIVSFIFWVYHEWINVLLPENVKLSI